MNKLYIVLFVVFFVNINAYQPPEYGLFFERSVATARQKAIVNRKKVSIVRDKRAAGTDSSVYIVKNVQEFLYFVTKQSLPLILNVYSKEDSNKFLYQEIADSFINKFIFISIDSTKNKQLLNLIFLFLRFDGFSVFPAKIKYPIVLFCKQNSILLRNGLIHLKKGSIKNLINPGFFDEKELLLKLEENLDFK